MRSWLRLVGLGWGQFWPYFLPVVRAQVAAGDRAKCQALNAWAFFNWHTPLLPIAYSGDGHTQLFCQMNTSTNHSRGGFNGVLIVNFGDLDSFHAATLTRFVFAGQHHVLTLFVFNQRL